MENYDMFKAKINLFDRLSENINDLTQNELEIAYRLSKDKQIQDFLDKKKLPDTSIDLKKSLSLIE